MSEAPPHCCENNCHNINYYDETERRPMKKKTQVAGQLSSKINEANCHKAMDKRH